MGAIVLNRYVVTEPKVSLDVSVSISGALCTIYQKDYERSKRTWQRVITGHMKGIFFRGKWGNRLHRMLGSDDYQSLLRAQNIVVCLCCRCGIQELQLPAMYGRPVYSFFLLSSWAIF